MLRSDLITKLAEDKALTLSEATRAVDAFFYTIITALSQNKRVELRGFGVFEPKELSRRVGRNPATGEKVAIPKKIRARFRTGKPLRDRLNPSER